MEERIYPSILVVAVGLFVAFACPHAVLADSNEFTTTGIAPGTVISHQNWPRYRDYMSEGLIALFEGKHFWHLPTDLRIEVGPTVSIPLPKRYLEDTARYSSQVKLLENTVRRLRSDRIRCWDSLSASVGRGSRASRAANLLGLVLPLSAACPRGPDFYLYPG
jgi:hypothetical protein